jgi:hypothetical protein
MFRESDLRQLEEREIAPAAAERQIELLRNPPRPVALARAATLGDGIARLDLPEQQRLESAAAAPAAAGRLMAFVPASGAATRMFKDLRAALDAPDVPSSSEVARAFFESIESFPFIDELRGRAGRIEAREPEDERRILRLLLDDLGYAEKPKGLIPFHRTAHGPRTPFEEHLLQARRFLQAADGTVRAHFTVAADHLDEFARALERLRPRIEADGARLRVGFSVQHPSTDTLAIDDAGEPFRTSDGALLFRPAGHGALLVNLEAAEADLVSIRNIDNVVPDEASSEVVRWKRILIGALVRLQSEVFEILGACDGGTEEDLERGLRFAEERFGRVPRHPLGSSREKAGFVRAALERPLRVCGVVRNEGEPGGAPFWIVEGDGSTSLQIVESSQVDLDDPDQRRIWSSSTHFNPVDIVAGMRNRNGEPFELASFVDPDAVFVAKKSHEGRELLALERPGLWNGAMAGWNSLFVEVPAETFAPVKTVLDLLRPAHQ